MFFIVPSRSCLRHESTCEMHQSYSFADSFVHAYTCIPFEARNAAISSCAVSGFPPHATTVAPSSFAPKSSTDVSFVICRQNPIVMPLRGFVFLNLSRVLSNMGMWFFAHSCEIWPFFARRMSRTLYFTRTVLK